MALRKQDVLRAYIDGLESHGLVRRMIRAAKGGFEERVVIGGRTYKITIRNESTQANAQRLVGKKS